MPPTGNPHTDTMVRFHQAHAKERDEIMRLMMKLVGFRAAALVRQSMTRRD